MADISIQQQKFVNEYLILGNATNAAIAAGYSAKTAQSQGSRLLSQPSIKQMIESRQQLASVETRTSMHDLLAELEAARVQALAQGQCSAAINAPMGKAKLLGFDKPKDVLSELRNEPIKITRVIVDVAKNLEYSY